MRHPNKPHADLARQMDVADMYSFLQATHTIAHAHSSNMGHRQVRIRLVCVSVQVSGLGQHPGQQRCDVHARQFFELIEDPLLNLVVPMVLQIVVPIIMEPLLEVLSAGMDTFINACARALTIVHARCCVPVSKKIWQTYVVVVCAIAHSHSIPQTCCPDAIRGSGIRRWRWRSISFSTTNSLPKPHSQPAHRVVAGSPPPAPPPAPPPSPCDPLLLARHTHTHRAHAHTLAQGGWWRRQPKCAASRRRGRRRCPQCPQ